MIAIPGRTLAPAHNQAIQVFASDETDVHRPRCKPKILCHTKARTFNAIILR